MNTTATPSPLTESASVPSPEQTLRRLFLTLFLRGRSSRGLQKSRAPKSVGQKLALTLLLYALMGLLALAFIGQPVFALSVYLHAMTFVFLGMFVASSAGEILFNPEEADILLHRPIEPRALLWAKVRVLVEVSLWMAAAFNLVGFFVGMQARDGGWLFLVAHVVSTSLEAVFCTSCVVMVYQLCLRWFGRERLEGLMTTAQVLISVGAVLSGQILPQFVMRFDKVGHLNEPSWWIVFLPPAWFAGFDDALAGSGSGRSWLLALVGLAATALVAWISLGKLARDYHAGLQSLNETVSRRPRNAYRRRWMDVLVGLPPLRWWLRDPVTRAIFLLSGAYLMRDRDVKLRIYPGLAPIMIMPLIMMVRRPGGDAGGGEFGIAFAGAYVGLVPMLGIGMLQYSQQWRAADIFRAAPIAGPAAICHGARRAVLCFLTIPTLLVFGLLACLFQGANSNLLLLLPGIIALPVYSLVPSVSGAVPLSVPTDEAKSAGRGLSMIAVIMTSMVIGGLATFSWTTGWFREFIIVEALVAAVFYAVLRLSLARDRWAPLE